MTLLHALAIFAAGIAAGTINTRGRQRHADHVPRPARVRLCPGHRERVEHGRARPGLGRGRDRLPPRAWPASAARALRFAIASVAGGIVGAILLLSLPASAFKAIVPAFIVIALVLIVLQPRIGARARSPAARGRERASGAARRCAAVFAHRHLRRLLRRRPGDHAARDPRAVAPEGEDLQRVNALKVVLAGLVNLVAGVIFIFAAHIAWLPALLIAIGSIIGGDRRRALGPAAAAGGAARGDRRGGDHRDRPAALERSSVGGTPARAGRPARGPRSRSR